MIKQYLKKINDYRYFKKHNPKALVDKTINLRLPKYIHCEDVYIGKNSKLSCWDTYNNIKLNTIPNITISSGFRATSNFSIQCANKVIIKENVLVASNVFIIDYNHGNNPLTKSYLQNPLDISSGVIIEEGCWIGNNVTILGGITIGKKAIIGAGAVVTHDIPEYCIAAGNPARVIKKFNFSTQSWDKIVGEK